MSGGSLDNLYSAGNRPDGMFSGMWALEKAAEELAKVSGESTALRAAAKEAKEILLGMKGLRDRFTAFSGVLHDVEWCLSGDYTREQLGECAVEWFNKRTGP